jgi:hypothetical protein
MNDLQFLTGPAIGQITASGGQDVVEGSSSLDLQAYDAAGLPAGPAWPKLTGDWTVATPTLGSFGTFDTSPAAHKVLVSITRSGTLSVYNTAAPVCSPSSSPRFHHDNWSSGDYSVDAIDPGKPYNVARGGSTITFNAPGGNLMCGRAARYQLVTSNRPITPENFASAKRLTGAPHAAAAGARQSLTVPAGVERYVAIRAVDQAGNLGLPAVIDTGRTGLGSGSGSGGSPGANRPPFTGAADRPRAQRP